MPDKELRLLSLDGGGVRGLSSLYILRNLMEKIDPGAAETPKPCDYFDMIGGTSTGGLIAIMLGRLEMSVDQCIAAYTTLSEEIFAEESKSRFRFSLRGNLKSRFDAKRLEKAIITILQSVGMDENTLLSSPNAKCKVFVCAASQNNETVILRSYSSPRDNRRLGYVRIWEACRATSAAQGFFDPITIPPGTRSELFTDGGIRANNPVKELWGQASDLWATDTSPARAEQLRQKLRCLVSTGTGRPDLPSHQISVRGVVKVLKKIATDTEAVAEAFIRENPELDRDHQYFRFNVDRGLKGIGLDECGRLGEITSATAAYIESQAVFTKMQDCAKALSPQQMVSVARPALTRRNTFGDHTTRSAAEDTADLSVRLSTIKPDSRFRVPFKLDGVVRNDKFVSRPDDTYRLEEVLLQNNYDQTRIFVLHGMGGIGKTQLAIHFAYENKDKFSSVFWLQAQTEEALRQSLLKCAKRIPKHQISAKSRRGNPANRDEQQVVVDEVLEWLSQDDNNNWLIIFDNVDLDYRSAADRQRGAFNVTEYIPGSHGSVLITTRLDTLAQIGSGRSNEEVTTVNYETSQRIFESWYGQTLVDDNDTQSLLGPQRLSGLPLALAQSAVYVRQNKGMSIAEYLRRFDSMWAHVMGDPEDRPLYDYHGAVGVTWALAMQQVREKSEEAATLAEVWPFLDNQDFTFELFRELPRQLPELGLTAEEHLEWSQDWPPKWLGDLGTDEGRFHQHLQLLQSYRLAISDSSGSTSQVHNRGTRYAMHPLVHRWAMNTQTPVQRRNSIRLALWIFADLKSIHRQQMYWNRILNDLLIPHLSSCLNLIRGDTDLQSAVFSHLPSLVALRDIACYDAFELDIVHCLADFILTHEDGQPRGIPIGLRYAVLVGLGQSLFYRNREDEAEAVLARAQQLLFNMPAGTESTNLRDLPELASLLVAQAKVSRDPQQACKLLEELIERAPESAEAGLQARLKIARVYQEEDNLVAAETYIRQACVLYNKHFLRDDAARLVGELSLIVFNLMVLITTRSCTDQDRLRETQKISVRAFWTCHSLFSADSLRTHMAAILLSFTYIISGQLENAEAAIGSATSNQELLADSRVSTGVYFCLKVLIMLCAQQKRFTQAEGLVTKLRLFLTRNENHVNTLEVRNHAGDTRDDSEEVDKDDSNDLRSTAGEDSTNEEDADDQLDEAAWLLRALHSKCPEFWEAELADGWQDVYKFLKNLK